MSREKSWLMALVDKRQKYCCHCLAGLGSKSKKMMTMAITKALGLRGLLFFPFRFIMLH